MCVQLNLLLKICVTTVLGVGCALMGLNDHDQCRTIVSLKVHTSKQNTSTDAERKALPQLPHNLISLSCKHNSNTNLIMLCTEQILNHFTHNIC
jgi:hypothetical protein